MSYVRECGEGVVRWSMRVIMVGGGGSVRACMCVYVCVCVGGGVPCVFEEL